MNGHNAFTSLREVLAFLYENEQDARRIANDAGLDVQHISFSGKAINNWDAILRQAQKEGKTAKLMGITFDEFTGNEKLSDAWHDFLTTTNTKASPSLSLTQSQSTMRGRLGWIAIVLLPLIILVIVTLLNLPELTRQLGLTTTSTNELLRSPSSEQIDRTSQSVPLESTHIITVEVPQVAQDTVTADTPNHEALENQRVQIQATQTDSAQSVSLLNGDWEGFTETTDGRKYPVALHLTQTGNEIQGIHKSGPGPGVPSVIAGTIQGILNGTNINLTRYDNGTSYQSYFTGVLSNDSQSISGTTSDNIGNEGTWEVTKNP